MLLVAAVLTVLIGIAHSYLGERYILIRLFRRALPPLFGDDRFTKNTLRFAWHITTIAWIGMAVIFCYLHFDALSKQALLGALGATFGLSGLTALIASKGRHLSWVVFFAIAILAYRSVPL